MVASNQALARKWVYVDLKVLAQGLYLWLNRDL